MKERVAYIGRKGEQLTVRELHEVCASMIERGEAELPVLVLHVESGIPSTQAVRGAWRAWDYDGDFLTLILSDERRGPEWAGGDVGLARKIIQGEWK